MNKDDQMIGTRLENVAIRIWTLLKVFLISRIFEMIQEFFRKNLWTSSINFKIKYFSLKFFKLQKFFDKLYPIKKSSQPI
jgi:hypothetical protein